MMSVLLLLISALEIFRYSLLSLSILFVDFLSVMKVLSVVYLPLKQPWLEQGDLLVDKALVVATVDHNLMPRR